MHTLLVKATTHHIDNEGNYSYVFFNPFQFCRLIHSVDKNLSEHGEKLDEKTKTEVQEALEAAKKGNLLYFNLQLYFNNSCQLHKDLKLCSPALLYSISDPLYFKFLVDGEVDIETLKEAVTNLSNASMKIGQAIYSKKGDESNPSDNEDADKKKDDTQEAEFTEKKK